MRNYAGSASTAVSIYNIIPPRFAGKLLGSPGVMLGWECRVLLLKKLIEHVGYALYLVVVNLTRDVFETEKLFSWT